jgi:hypothetical protein
MANHLFFQPVDIQHRPMMLPFLRKHSQTCDRTFTNQFCWQRHYHTQWAEANGWLVVRAHINGERRAAYIPFSQKDNPNYSEIIPLLEEDAKSNDQTLTLMGLSEEECKLLQQQYPNDFVFDSNRDFADYIYRAEDLRTLKGRKYAQKRNHVNKFKSLYSFHYEPITRENIADCLHLEEEWIAQHNQDESALAEYHTIQLAFQHFEVLELLGGALYVDNQIVAFTYGSPANDHVFCTHVEKGDLRYEGIYQMINHQFAQHIPEQYIYINREEDLGMPGLRKSKLSYEPAYLAYKTTALKMTSEMRDMVGIWDKCFGADDPTIYPFLSRYYFYHCSVTEKVDGKVVSMAFVVPCHTEMGLGAYFYGVATDPEYQHRGISSRLIRKMLEKCKELGAQFSFLIPGEPSLIDFYAPFGFLPTNSHVVFQCDMDLGTGDKEKDRIIVLPLTDGFRIKNLPDTLVCQPML